MLNLVYYFKVIMSKYWNASWSFCCNNVKRAIRKTSIKMQRRQWQPPLVLLPGKSHGLRNPVGCSTWGCEESDTTKWLHFHFSLSCIGEGNGNTLQGSCLENPRGGGAWWAASMGSHRVRHYWSDLAAATTALKWLIMCIHLYLVLTKAKGM